MAYGEDEIYANINSQYTLEALHSLGFTVTEKDEDRSGAVKVRGQKSALALESIGSYRDSLDRVSDNAMAAALTQFYQIIGNDAEIRQSVGIDQMLDVVNRVGQMLGLPRDFKLQKINDGQGPEQQAEQMVAIAEEIKGSVLQEVGQAIEPIAKNTQENTSAIEQLIQIINQAPQPPADTQYDNPVQATSGVPEGAPNPELVKP
jgi:hypothetical protein